MLIDKHIGFDEAEGWGVMGDLFQKELLALDSMDKKRIQVWINSPGGIVTEGYNIYNAILRSKTQVDTLCIGMAASIAGVIFQAGRTRIMADYSWLMYHNPYGGDDDGGMETITESIAIMVASRTGKSEEAIRKIMNKTSYILAAEALENGLCDAIDYSADANMKRKVSKSSDAKVMWKEYGRVLNKILEHKTTPEMKRIANRLNLNNEASEDRIVAEIDRIQTKNRDLDQDCRNKEKELADKRDELRKKGDEYDALRKEHDKLRGELDALRSKMDDDEEDRKDKDEMDKLDKAKNLILGYVSEGRMRNEAGVIAAWIEKAKNDPEGVRGLLESLPVNRRSVSIAPAIKHVGGGKVGSVMANKMSELIADLTK